jgi:superfamily II DNA/RNA helicase
MPETTTPSAASDETAEGPTTTTTQRPVKSFTDVGVDPALAEALAAKGIHAPFPIQELTLPIATKGHDVIGQARTGTGKTLAFALALLGRVTPGGGTQALVIVPTRELCLQVAEEMQIGQALGLRTIAVYGGVGYEEQETAFREGHEIVVGTPGRLLDHVNKRNLILDGVTELVLDEADEMLDMGFLPDVERLIGACAEERHGMLFSATMPSEVVKLARRYLDHPTFMRADHEVVQTAPNVTQHFFQVHRMDKPRVLARILQSPERGGVYVFVRTKHMADRLVRELEDLATPAIAIHGDLRQAMREKNLDKFRDGSATVLVATEVAARGLDVENVTHVVNYDCPDDEKMYLHRIGRTARAGGKGVAITFAEFNEIDRLNVVRKKLGQGDNPVATIFSTSDELTERFDLPEERPWDAHVAAAKAGTRTDRRAPEGDDRGRGGRGGGRDGGRGGKRDGGRGGERDGGRGGKRDRDRGSGRSGGGRAEAPREEAPREEAPREEARREEQPRERGSREGARKGSSDGRPKSKRSSEGTGNDRDADRSRRDRDASASDATEATERRRGGGDDGDGTARTRTRTRTRTRSTDTASDEGGSRASRNAEGAERTSGSSGRTRARSSARRGGGTEGPDRSGSGRSGSDRGSSERGSSERGSSDRGSSERGGSERSGSDRGGSDRTRGGAKERGRSGRSGSSNRGGRSGGRDRGERSGDRQGGRRDGGDTRGGRRSGSGRDLDPTVKPARRGEEARGEGDPQLARRVKVEHLP